MVDVVFFKSVPNLFSLIAIPTVIAASLPLSHYLDSKPGKPEEQSKDAIEAVEKEKEEKLLCFGCSPNEQAATDFFYDRGITDKLALATVLGNIKQESRFIPDICEGGFRTAYHKCGRGYGLIQFTSASRYYGLGRFAKQKNADPSTLHIQLHYIVTEPQWRRVEPIFKRDGLSVNNYMNAAYSWLGWGIHGARTQYAWQYADKLKYMKV